MARDVSSRARHGVTVWLTGLPSAGKTTIAQRLSEQLEARGYPVEVLDGDEIRLRLSKGLGFSKADRDEHIRRVAYVAKLLTRVGATVIVSAISPYRSVREEARAEIRRFVEVYVNCAVEECMRRDVKGLYQKALRGELANFTGVSDPYEPPLNPDVVVNTDRETLEESMGKILKALERLGYLPVQEVAPVSQEEEAQILSKLKTPGYLE